MSEQRDDYLERALERVEVIWREIGATWTPRLETITKSINAAADPPFVWLYPAPMAPVPIASATNLRNHAITMRLVLAAVGEGDDDDPDFGTNEARLARIIPSVMNYFDARRSLITMRNERPVRFLQGGGARISQITPRGEFVSSPFIEAWFQLSLTFIIPVDPVFGN